MTAILALLAAISPESSSESLHVQVTADGTDKCTIIWNGEPLEQDALLERARSVPDKRKKAGVRIVGGETVPYRCIGGVIYTLQMAGFARVGFIAEPPPPPVTIAIDRHCRLKLDGRRTTLEVLRAQVSGWAAEEADVHLKADPNATYQCVAPIAKIIADAGVAKVGVVGGPEPQGTEK